MLCLGDSVHTGPSSAPQQGILIEYNNSHKKSIYSLKRKISKIDTLKTCRSDLPIATFYGIDRGKEQICPFRRVGDC